MKTLPKFLIIIFGFLAFAFFWLKYEADTQRAAKQELAVSLPEQAGTLSTDVFGTDFPAIEQAKHFGMEFHLLLTEQHLDYPVKLRKFSERFCALEAKTHCYLLFYTDRAALPLSADDMNDYVNPQAFFTINKATGVDELTYSFEDGARSDAATNNSDSLQQYFAGHNKLWQ